MGEKGDALLFLQPIEVDYLQDLKIHGVDLTELPLKKTIDTLSVGFLKNRSHEALSIEAHPWILALQNAVESFVSGEVLI